MVDPTQPATPGRNLLHARARVRTGPRSRAGRTPRDAGGVHRRRRTRGGGVLRAARERGGRCRMRGRRRGGFPSPGRRAPERAAALRRPGAAPPRGGGLDLDARLFGPDLSRPGSRPGALARRARPEPLPLPSLPAGVAGRDRPRLPVPMQFLLGLAALRALFPREVDRRRRGRSRLGRGERFHRGRPLLEPSRAQPRPRGRSEETRREEAVAPRADAHGPRLPPAGSPRGVAAPRERLRRLLRAGGGLRRGARRDRQGHRRVGVHRGGADLAIVGLRRHRAISSSIRTGTSRGSASSGTSWLGTASSARDTRS